MRRTKTRRNLTVLSFVQTLQSREIINEPDILLCDFYEHSSLRVGAEQEQLAFGDPVSGSGAAEPLSNRRRKHRKADGEAYGSPGLLGQGERFAAGNHLVLRSRL